MNFWLDSAVYLGNKGFAFQYFTFVFFFFSFILSVAVVLHFVLILFAPFYAS